MSCTRILLGLGAWGLGALVSLSAYAQPSTYSLDYVQKAYVAYYGRPADPGGQNYWAARMDAEGGSLSAIIAEFGNSAEFNQRYGGLSYSALVTKIYQQALGRDPDSGGLAYYVGELQAGRRTLQSITLDVLNGATTPPDSTVVSNKLEVAANYTARVAAGCAYGTEQDGVAVLAGVTWNAATVYATKAAIDSRCRAPGSARLGTVIEYYSPKLRHYFLTAFADEAAALDTGAGGNGWTRTGGEFSVYKDAAPGLKAVCRFSRTPGTGPESHIYAADAAECAALKSQSAWTYDGIAFYLATPVGGQCGNDWPVYRSYYTNNVSDANHRFTVDLTAHVRMPKRRGDVLEGIVMCAPVADAEREADVVRFLEQATLGHTETLVQEVKAKGIAAWLDEQIPMNVTRYTAIPFFDDPGGGVCFNRDPPPFVPETLCGSFHRVPDRVSNEFYRQARTAPDQLRLRMAHVWHQILVAYVGSAYGSAEFHQRLRDHAFGTYENLLTKYAISPQLGVFQNWVMNVPEHDGIKPNENFARELLQLFTIGVSELNDDGTLKVDANGQPKPTYGQPDIENLARVLTGFSFPTVPGDPPAFYTRWNFLGDMIPWDAYHDKGAKSLLNGRLVLPPGGGADAEFKAAIKMLLDHPNTPPFISRQLIQKMVTSSPTPGYVARVVAVFKDNGQGKRGDLAAVTRAILLDAEARGARKIDIEYGRLREPVLFATAMLRALDIATDGNLLRDAGIHTGQNLFFPATVFNYYPADYTLYDGAVPAPEFAIFGSSDFITLSNQLMMRLLYFGEPPSWTVENAIGTTPPTLTAFLPDAANADVLVERMNRLFLHGTMTAGTRKTVVNAVNKIPAGDALRRVRMAINLTMMSIQYLIQR